MITQLIVDWEKGRWLLYCSGKNKFLTKKDEDGSTWVLECYDEKRECVGCYPRGFFPFDPNKAEIIIEKEANSMSYSQKELDGYLLSPEIVQKIIAEYEQKPEQYYYIRHVSCDLDTVTIFKINEKKEG
jgi:hypothetical protein